MKNLVIAIVLILFLSCNNRKNGANVLFEIQESQQLSSSPPQHRITIDKPDEAKLTSLMLSDFVDSIRYTQIEYTKKALLPEEGGTGLRRCKDLIFTSYSDVLYLFDSDGKFIRQYGSVGKGPGEYKLTEFDVNISQNIILIGNYFADGYVLYNINGQHIGSVYNRDTSMLRITRSQKGNPYLLNDHILEQYYFEYKVNNEKGIPIELMLYNYRKQKKVDDITNRFPVKTEQMIVTRRPEQSRASVKQNDSVAFYKAFYNDTLYIIKKESILPFAIIDLGRFRIQDDLVYNLKADLTRKIGIHDLYVSNNCIYLNCYYWKGAGSAFSFLCKYDLQSKNTTYHSTRIVNNIDGGADVGLKSLKSKVRAVPFSFDDEDDKWQSNLDNKLLKHPELKQRFQTMQNKRKENDNPLLMLLYTKE